MINKNLYNIRMTDWVIDINDAEPFLIIFYLTIWWVLRLKLRQRNRYVCDTSTLSSIEQKICANVAKEFNLM